MSQRLPFSIQIANARFSESAIHFPSWSGHKEGDRPHFVVVNQYIMKARDITKSTASVATPSLVIWCHHYIVFKE